MSRSVDDGYKGLLNKFKIIYPMIYDGNGNLRLEPVGELKKLKGDRLKLVELAFEIMFNDRIFNNVLLLFVTDKYLGFSDAVKKYEDTNNVKLKYNNEYNKMNDFEQKFVRIIGKNFVQDVVYGGAKDISDYVVRLNTYFCKNGVNKHLRDEVMLDIKSDILENECEEVIFDDFLRKIEPYIKKNVDDTVKMLPVSALGYFNYLISSKMLSEYDNEQLNKIKRLFNGELTFRDSNDSFDEEL